MVPLLVLCLNKGQHLYAGELCAATNWHFSARLLTYLFPGFIFMVCMLSAVSGYSLNTGKI